VQRCKPASDGADSLSHIPHHLQQVDRRGRTAASGLSLRSSDGRTRPRTSSYPTLPPGPSLSVESWRTHTGSVRVRWRCTGTAMAYRANCGVGSFFVCPSSRGDPVLLPLLLQGLIPFEARKDSVSKSCSPSSRETALDEGARKRGAGIWRRLGALSQPSLDAASQPRFSKAGKWPIIAVRGIPRHITTVVVEST
jgi:hypothetical protein